MKNKRVLFISVLLFLAAGSIFAQTTVSLNEAMVTGVNEIEDALEPGTKVVLLNFRSASPRFSDYVLDEMMTILVRNRKLTVVDRSNLELIQQEMAFQMSGEVSDSSAQSIGQKLGAQSIISGSIEDMGTYYRIRFRTINVETAAIQALSSSNVTRDTQMVNFLAPGTTAISTAHTQEQASVTGYPNGLNFSKKQKTGAAFGNMLLGLGSFRMGDWVGGLIVGGLQAAGLAVGLTGMFNFAIGYPDFYMKDDEKYDEHHKWIPTAQFPTERSYDDAMSAYDGKALIMFWAGSGVYVVGWIVGFVRPFDYDKALAKKNGTYFAFDPDNPFQNISFGLVPAKTGMQMGLTYSLSY